MRQTDESYEGLPEDKPVPIAPEDVDTCMTLGAGMPMGPVALLDFVGLDVAEAIGDAIGANVPPKLRELVREGELGRKTRRGFYAYE